jgi:hypothetical protein
MSVMGRHMWSLLSVTEVKVAISCKSDLMDRETKGDGIGTTSAGLG